MLKTFLRHFINVYKFMKEQLIMYSGNYIINAGVCAFRRTSHQNDKQGRVLNKNTSGMLCRAIARAKFRPTRRP